MTLEAKQLNEVITFTRGSGKTRTNAAGLIVGVDFSSTSNTITTGSKTFTLAADLNVNRDWATGSAVRAVDQVGGGVLMGTVTSYAPSTQALVIEVNSVTGSGTSTNWRIGTLEITRDVATNAVSSEPAATNLLLNSGAIANAYFGDIRTTRTANFATGVEGSLTATRVDASNVGGATDSHYFFRGTFNATAGEIWTLSIYAKPETFSRLALEVTGAFGTDARAIFSLNDQVVSGVTPATTNIQTRITPATNGFYRCSMSAAASATTSALQARVYLVDNAGALFYQGLGTNTQTLIVDAIQLEVGQPTSYIPTTTAQVTRNADSFALTSTAINSIRQGQGTLYVEAESADVGPTQKRAIRLSGSTGDIRLAKRGVGNFSGFTKMLEVDNDLYFGATAGNSQRCNGKEMGSFSAVNERNNALTTQGTITALAYDGTSTFLVANVNNDETFFTKTLSFRSNKGFGSTTLLGGVYTGNRFVFSSGLAGTLFLSTDGLTWRRRNTAVITQPQVDVNFGVIGGVNRLVSTGNNGSIFTSDDDGETWVSRTGVGTVGLNYGTFAAGLFVIARQSTTNSILTSPDGITWVTRTTPGAQGMQDVAHNGTNLFVAVGNNGLIITSPDAITWTQRTSGTTNSLLNVHFAAGQWVAVGNAGTILTSPDGTTWTTQTSGTTNSLRVVSFFNNLFVIGGQLTLLTSPDGVTWTSRTPNASSTFLGISASANRLVLAGDTGAVITSEDATTYTSRTNNAAGINGMAFGNGVFVSVGNAQGGSGYIATIDAAGNYTRRVSGTVRSLRTCRFLGGAFYTSQSDSGGNIFRSVDGITWATVGTFATGRNDTAYNGVNTYVSVGSNGTYATSSNGITWPGGASDGQIAGEGATTLNEVFFANGLFVTVGSAGKIFTSPNGTTWTLRTSGTTQNLNSVMYSTRDQLWYAAGNAGTLLASEDAITWRSVQNAGFASIDNTTLQATELLPVWQNGKNRIAVSYRNNQVIASLNGVSVSDAAATIPTITAGALGENLNGLVYKMQFSSEAVTEAELNAMTGI